MEPNKISFGMDERERRFGYRKATPLTVPQHEEARRLALRFAAELDALLPAGRAKSTAFTHLETVTMWAHKAIAEQDPVVPV